MTFAEDMIHLDSQKYAMVDELTDAVFVALGIDTSGTFEWPCDDVGYDPSDWAGISIELRNATPGIEFLDVTKLKEMGFDIICIHYNDGTRRRIPLGAEKR